MLDDVCATCRKRLYSGIQVRSRRYCARGCYERDERGRLADAYSPLQARQFATKLRGEACPKCQRSDSPISAWIAYRIYSAPFLMYRTADARICCQRCGIRHVLFGMLISLLLGWWGRGIFHTPVMLVTAFKTARRQLRGPHPTPEFCDRARYVLVDRGIKPAARLEAG